MKRWMPEEEWEKAQLALAQFSKAERQAYEPMFVEGTGIFGGLVCKGENCRQAPGQGHYESCPYGWILED